MATLEELEKRVATLEQANSRLETAAVYIYILFLSIPRKFRNEDPDFDEYKDKFKNLLDLMMDVAVEE